MATKIKKTVFIGLGGTGMRSVLSTKKLFYDTYGEIPPMIAFLGIDTDGGAYNKELTARDGTTITLSPAECMAIQVNDAKAVFNVNKENLGWVPDCNITSMTTMTRGAGQIRTNGRFALANNLSAVRHKIQDVVHAVSDARINENKNYARLDSDIEFHIAFSVCGGTGSGTFLDVAYLIRKDIDKKAKVLGYGLMPGVFNAMASGAAMERVDANAYGALMDLDFLMGRQWGSKDVRPIELKYLATEDTRMVDERPFTTFYFIDNVNGNHDSYSQVDQLADMVSVSWVTAAGELSDSAASVADNTDKVIESGAMDVEDKKPWVSALGVAEIVFRGSTLAEIYALKAAKQIINKLFSTSVDATSIADAWIDTVKIRENNNNDDVINRLLDPNDITSIELEKDECLEPESAVEGWLRNNKPNQKELDEAVEKLKNETADSLYDKVKQLINCEGGINEGGISVAEQFLISVERSIDIFIDEMKTESTEFHESLPNKEANLDTAAKELKKCADTFFKRGLDEKKEEYLDSLKSLVVTQREEARRNTAVTFFNYLKSEVISELKAHTDTVHKLIMAAEELIGVRLASVTNGAGRKNQVFQIDLSRDYVSKVEVNSSDINLSEFLKDLEGQKVYDFSNRRKEEIAKSIVAYAETLTGANKWRNLTLNTIFDEMSESEFDSLVDLSIRKASPMLRIDRRGYLAGKQSMDHYYVGVFDKENCRLTKGDYFKRKLSNSGSINVTASSIGDPSHAVIYHQDSVFPGFFVYDLRERCKIRYENDSNPERYHFNNDVYTQMVREDFSIDPKKRTDDSVEIWTSAIIFGRIKNEDNMYYVKDETNRQAFINDYWVALDQYRDRAFELFKKDLKHYREITVAQIEKICSQRGQAAIDELRADVTEGQNYLLKYAQLGFEPKKLTEHGRENEFNLVMDEDFYVKNKF